MKYCWKCKKDHEEEEFYKNRHTKDGLDQICKTERRLIVDSYNKKNLEKIRLYSREYYHKNKQADKVRKRLYNKEYIKNKRNTDPLYKIAHNLRKRLTSALKGNYKSGSAIKDLGCSIENFKVYIESLWQPGMTWDNYGKGAGKWSIDHIKPLTSYDLANIEDFKKANHYTNLQPMWFTENCRKWKNTN